MDKKICAFLFTITFFTLSGVVYGNPQNIQRGPSVEPIVEIDIEDVKKADMSKESGFDFSSNERMPANQKARTPANIVTKTQSNPPSSYIGPLIFLIALPFGLWIMVSKKFSKKTSDEKTVGYFPKTQQFSPYKTDYQKPSDDDDVDFPKAS